MSFGRTGGIQDLSGCSGSLIDLVIAQWAIELEMYKVEEARGFVFKVLVCICFSF